MKTRFAFRSRSRAVWRGRLELALLFAALVLADLMLLRFCLTH